MNKTQAAAVLAVGIGLGVGGTKLTAASPGAPQIRVHALDLRTGAVTLEDGGFHVSRVAYGTLLRPDGGTKDIGQAKKCDDRAQASLTAAMNAAASDCTWDLP